MRDTRSAASDLLGRAALYHKTSRGHLERRVATLRRRIGWIEHKRRQARDRLDKRMAGRYAEVLDVYVALYVQAAKDLQAVIMGDAITPAETHVPAKADPGRHVPVSEVDRQALLDRLGVAMHKRAVRDQGRMDYVGAEAQRLAKARKQRR